MAIERVKGLEHLALLGVIQAAIGQHAIHIKKNDPHGLGAGQPGQDDGLAFKP